MRFVMAARGRGGRGRSTLPVENPEAPKKRRQSSKGRGGESAAEAVVEVAEKDSLVSRWGS